MFKIIPEAQVKATNERIRFLYSNGYIIDAITACLMDTSSGNMGLHEVTARAKAHRILDWLLFVRNNAPLNPGAYKGYEELWAAPPEEGEKEPQP